MANQSKIFLCYSKSDLSAAKELYNRLRKAGLNPWMDEKSLVGGEEWDLVIQKEIKTSDYVFVLLSNSSARRKGYYRKEINYALEIRKEKTNLDRFIIPIRLEDCTIPKNLTKFNCINLYVRGEFNRLIKPILNEFAEPENNASIVNPEKISKMMTFPIGGVDLPCFFPSITSVSKNNLSPLEHLKVITAMNYPLFLISAFDIHRSKRDERLEINGLLTKASKNGQVILIDSGLFEKKRLQSTKWSKNNFYQVLKSTPCHLCFSFDNQSIKDGADIHMSTQKLIDSVEGDKKKGELQSIMPIIHCSDSEKFASTCEIIANRISPPLIVIPERELGEGVLKIVETLIEIRKSLNSTGKYIPIHLLGTGNPISILIYSAFGVDSFDGIDWCQSVVDYETAYLHHSLQLDFVKSQSSFADEKELSYFSRVLGHNLLFYKNWMRDIRQHLIENNIEEMLNQYVPNSILPQISKLLKKEKN